MVDVSHTKYHLLPRYLATAMELCLLVPARVVEILGLIRSETKVAKAKKDPVVVDQTETNMNRIFIIIVLIINQIFQRNLCNV